MVLAQLALAQATELQSQRKQLEIQKAQIDALILPTQDLSMRRGRGGALPDQAVQATSGPAPQSDPPMPTETVGEPPQQEDNAAEVAAVPQEQGVLTPAGQLVLDPIFDYTQSATDRLVFRGFELIPGIQVGLIEASKARRESIAPTMALGYGLTNRLEIEVRVPYMHRYDRIQVAPKGGQDPIFIGSLRAKSDTGKGPFDIGYDEFGVATGLATGSGFWGVQPGLSFLLPSDPVVIFGGVSYLWHIGRDINRTVGGAFVGHVDPGDSMSGNIGFGFALNPRFSFSLGYRQSYIRATRTEIGDITTKSTTLQVGSLNFGMSYRLNERVTANFGFEFGVTEDAPDLGVTIRFPVSLF